MPAATVLLGPAKRKLEAICTEVDDDPAQHGGRIRSFKHERGNWATYVYVPAKGCAEPLEEFQASAIAKLSPEVELRANDDLHLSLSRTVVLLHHQIDAFAQSVQTALRNCNGFLAGLQGLQVYTNDERTRTFIAAKLDSAFTEKATRLLQAIDLVMVDYRLPRFYEPPSFHISLLWCVGDQEKLLSGKLAELQKLLNDQETLTLLASEVHLKCGNRIFNYKLR
ncbi:hypothetical protein KR018_001873 [Drosophila ironensis]|nr:hypothetical protein KR018_001873 [Drosophila ironensis]